MTFRSCSAAILLITVVAVLMAQPPDVTKNSNLSNIDKARKLFSDGKLEEALRELQIAVQMDPSLTPARIQFAKMFSQAGNPSAARAQLELSAAEDPKHPEVYLANASYAQAEGRLTDCILNCQVALQLAADPRWNANQRKKYSMEARLGLAQAFETRRDWRALEDQMKALLVEDPTNSLARLRLGTAFFFLKQPDAAIEEFRKAHSIDPATDLPEVRMFALVAGTEPDEKKAEEWLRKAVAVHPKSPKSHRALASYLMDKGNLDEADAVVKTARSLDAESRETMALTGLLARYRRDYGQAEQSFEKLVRDYPNEPGYAWNLALVLAESSDAVKKRRAIETAEAETKRSSRMPESFAVLGYCLLKAGRLDDADRALGQATQLGSLSRDAGYFVARVLADKQLYEKAVMVLKQVDQTRGLFVYKQEATQLAKELEAKLPKAKDKQ